MNPPSRRGSQAPIGAPSPIVGMLAVGLGLAIGLVLVLGIAPAPGLASAPRARAAPGPVLEVIPRATASVPLFAGPATLELSGRAGAYTWDDVRFGADQVTLHTAVSGDSRPCGLFLALEAAADADPRADPADADGLLASGVVTTGPHEVASRESTVVVDYANASLRLIASCDEWSLRVEPLADPNLEYHVVERSYPVRGNTIRELAAQANQAQDGWAAYADWRTTWHFGWLDSGASCDVTGGEVALRVRITYPEWRPPTGANPGVVRRWGRFMDDLTIHELGHVTIALQGADAIDELLDGGITAATCAEVGRAADAAATRLHDRFERVNRRYDESTDHGVAQGTGLP